MSDHTSLPAVAQTALPAAEAVSYKQGEQPIQEPGMPGLQRLPLQRKLAVGATDDPLEREADHIADRVMRMPETSFIQRKCAHCEEEEKAQRKPLASFIQKKGGETATEASDAVSSRISATRGGGGALPEATRGFMESRMETDLSSVRIHTGDYAAELSQQLNAQAFTVGNDIYFNSGKFSPQSDDGKHLLAHELTHTVQQCGAVNRLIQRTGARPPLRADCPSRPDDFIRLVVVNQETPQSVSIFWNNSGLVETAQCSTGKGGCCVPDGAPDNVVGCTEAQSAVNGSNCTQIGTFTVTAVRRQSSSGVDFWTQFIDSRQIALHEYSPVNGTPLSHGCVRMDHDMAVKIYCGAIEGRTRVEVRGFARPRCSNPALIREWLSDFSNASPRNDGDPANRELRRELITHMGLGHGETAQQELDTRIAGITDATTHSINPASGAAAIPRCAGVSGLGREVELLQRINPSQLNTTVTTAFRNNIALAGTFAAATTVVRQAGANLWRSAHGPAASVDDRPLYWTRNFIIRELQEWHPFFTLSTARRNALIHTFEMASRGLDVTAFAPVEAGAKRILITGFDPFGMDDSFGRPGAMSGMSVGNPSGAIVLALDGQTISGARCSALIQGVVFPVRYRDFDEGVVEEYVRHFTSGPNPADMIMTISRNRDDRIFELERFAGRARSGLPDNEGLSSGQAALEHSLARIHGRHARTDEFTESTLPRANMSAPPRVVQDDSYSGHLPNHTPVDQTTSPVPGPGVLSDSGSGGSYLSNEIFYRVSLLQLNQHTSIPMGHLHVPAGTQAEYPGIISTVQQILVRALNSTICPPEYNDAPDIPAFRHYT